MKWTAVAAIALIVAACVPAGEPTEASNASVVQPVRSALPISAPTPTPSPVGPTTFVFDGQLTQGGWIRGQAPGGTRNATLGGTALRLDSQGRFFAAFDRDAGPTERLTARLADGRELASPLTITPRAWNVEHVDVARRPGGPSEAFMAIRRPELARIRAARETDHDVSGWRQNFAWPVKGRISGRFGSQRIYRGEPGSYHSGLDIAPGRGVPYVAPADGVVVLAATSPFSLEGNLLMIDHGAGLNSAFLHSEALVVKEGDFVKQGQTLGYVGASGRATGPHLHWSLEWEGARLDPLLFLPPQ